MKKRKCMADGGMVLAADEKRETVEQMLARMNAKYGTGIPSPAPQPQAPAPQPQAPAQQQTGIVDSLRRRNEELKKAANYARGGVKRMEAGGIAGLPDNLIGGPRYDSPRGAFVWEDGTRRDGLTEQQGAQLDAEIAMNKARADAGIAQNAGASAAPVQTMAEQQVAAGINPNAPYRPGGIGDPHASALPFIPQPSIGRRAGRTMGYAAGGVKDFRIGDAAPVVGKGTGTSDEVPAVLAGDEVRLSNGEAVVVLPKKTANNEAAVEAIEGIIAATNGKPPVPRDEDYMGCGGVRKRMAQGGVRVKDDEPTPITAQDLYRPAYEGIGGALTYLNRGDPLRDAAAGIGSFFRESANQARGGDYGAEHYGVPSNPPAPTQSQVRAVDNSDASRAGIIQYLRDNPGNPASKPSISDNPVGAARADLKNTQNALAAAQGQLSAERFAQTTGNAGRVDYEKGGNGIRWNAGRNYDPTTGDFAPGTGVATVTGAAANGGVTMPGVQQNALGTSIAIGPGRYTAADGTETSDWTKTQDYADAQQRHQNNLAELARIQAGRHGRDPVQSLADLARIPMAQQAAKLESEKGALGNRLAGQQLSIGDINLRQQQALQALYAAHQAAKTPEQAAAIAEQIRVMTLKDRPSHWKPVITHGAKTLEGSEPDSGYLVHEQTGEVRPLKMGQENIPPIPKDKASLKVGQVYRMADGRIGTWIGNGFRPQ